jgi:hypothetical protein
LGWGREGGREGERERKGRRAGEREKEREALVSLSSYKNTCSIRIQLNNVI